MNNSNDISQKVLARIRSSRVHMHSRLYFTVRVAAVILLSLIILAISVFVLSFVVFSIHESGEQLLLGFGAQGVSTFFGLFPWLPLGSDILLILLLEWMLQSFKFGYRVPLLTLFSIVLVCSAALSALVDLTPLHGSLLDRADRGQLPLLGEMYSSIRDSHAEQGVVRGTVTAINSYSIVISHDDGDHDADDGTWIVELPPDSGIKVQLGERVYVFGTPMGQVIQAQGIGELSPDQ